MLSIKFSIFVCMFPIVQEIIMFIRIFVVVVVVVVAAAAAAAVVVDG